MLGSNRIAFCVFLGNFLNAKIREAAPLLMLSLNRQGINVGTQ